MLTKKVKRELGIVFFLLSFSAVVYLIQYLVFRNFHSEVYYFFQDLAFLGVNSLIVYLLIDRVLTARDRESQLKTQHLLAGIFFYALGVKLFNLLSSLLTNHLQVAKVVCVQEDWQDKDFVAHKELTHSLKLNFQYNPQLIQSLKELLATHQESLVRLIENPGLHEHEVFSDMLMAIFHLTEELNRRTDLVNNDQVDQEHLVNDIRRVYINLSKLWLDYMRHLKTHYAYLYLYNIRNRNFVFSC